MAKKLSGKALKIFEIIVYSISGAVALWGLTYIVLGLIATYGPLDNPIEEFNAGFVKLFKLGLFDWGIIIFCIGMAVGIITLLIIATTVDKTNEKAARRAARLAKIEADMNATAEAEAK